ncbi:MAG: tetratricopeptide repeat protein [Cellvibrionaceae bacterium]
MDKDTLSIARHYYDINKYQEAYDHLTSMSLIVDRKEQIPHHILLADILSHLGKASSAQVLTDELRSTFPDDFQCLTHWIRFYSDDFEHVRQAYELAQSMRPNYPDNYWFPLIMAYMAYHYRLYPKKTIIALIEETLTIEKNEATVKLAHQIFRDFNKKDQAKHYLDELVELAPSTQSTYRLLLNYLSQKERYTELSQLSYEAIRAFPNNEEFTEYSKEANRHLYGDYFSKLYNFSYNIGGKFQIERSSDKPWFRTLQNISIKLGLGIGLFIYSLGMIRLLLLTAFFAHYVIFTHDERNIKKQRKQRLKKQEYEYKDQLTNMQNSASILLSSSHLRHRFIYLDNNSIRLAEDIWCAPEDLHYDWDSENVKGEIQINKQDVKSIEISVKYVTINLRNGKDHVLYCESLKALEFLVTQLAQQGYKHKKTISFSRLRLTIACFFGGKASLTAAAIFTFAVSWQIGIILMLMAITNFLGLFFYRMANPVKTDVYHLIN